ncbi:MAG: PTS sugar transporter subunit IIA [Lachnospiraceae bacterium]|nr:PTS sugar transporter subunit IIA [Lachnospiraceae bacterium]
MNRFDERKRKIITAVANADGSITGKSLRLMLNLSIRTIQSEVSEINQQLLLIHSSNKGYSINTENFKLCNKQIEVSQSYEHLILRKLIFSNIPQHIDELADSLYMSTSSLEKVLNSFHPLFTKFYLRIARKKMYIQIEGDELSKRRFINYLIFEEANPAFNNIDNLKNYFPNMNTDKIKSIILNSIHKYNYNVESTYSFNLIVNIAIALYRMRSDYYVEYNVYEETPDTSIEYQIAQEICKQYASHMCITPTNADIVYMATLLTGQIKPLSDNSGILSTSEVLTPKFISQINDILLDIFNYYMLNIDYSGLLYNFALHIKTMIKRLQNMQPANNEILYSIKINCPFIHDVSVQIARKIEDAYQLQIPDSEIGYISIHIGYLIENSVSRKDKIYVLLLCHEYHHIAATIQKNIMDNFFNLIELSIYNPDQKQDILATNADLLITTTPINIAGKRTLCISPFYTSTDHVQIDKAIHLCLKERQKNYYNQFLSTLFHEKLFFKQDDLKNKTEAIRFLGQKIIDFGLAEEGFIQSVLKREDLSSTCFFDTFAIPHAMDLNARKTMFCVLISEKGIQWDKHTIHIVLMIAVQPNDRKEFMELYNGIVQSLEDSEKVTLLVSANTHLDFINYLKK